MHTSNDGFFVPRRKILSTVKDNIREEVLRIWAELTRIADFAPLKRLFNPGWLDYVYEAFDGVVISWEVCVGGDEVCHLMELL